MIESLISSYRGELAALSAAFIWAIASYIYGRLGQQLPPLVLNFVKSALSIGFVLLTLWLRGDGGTAMPSASFWLLSLSGAIGIGLGDTAFFASLNCLGPRRGLLMDSLAPPLTALLALLFLQEQLKLTAWLGILMTVGGVTWVVLERTPPDAIVGELRPRRGVVLGLLAAGGQAVGAVMSRAALVDNSVSPLWSTLVRLGAGVLVMLLLLSGQRGFRVAFKPLRSPRLFSIVAGTAFAGTFLGIWLQQTSVKYTAAGIAQSLSATSPLFAIPIAMLVGEKISVRAVVGVFIALIGIRLLFI